MYALDETVRVEFQGIRGSVVVARTSQHSHRLVHLSIGVGQMRGVVQCGGIGHRERCREVVHEDIRVVLQ